MAKPDEFVCQADEEGEPRLLPSDHEERVRTLSAKLIAATWSGGGSQIIIESKLSGEMTDEYAQLVASEALELVCSWLIHASTPFQLQAVSTQLPKMVLAMRTDSSGKFLEDVREEHDAGAY